MQTFVKYLSFEIAKKNTRNICLIFVAFQMIYHDIATKSKCVFRKLLCPSCMYKRSDQEKMQWSPTWWLSTKSHLVFFFNGKTAISIGRKKPRVAQVVIAKSAGLPDYHAHKKYLILPRQIPHKVNPIS